MNPQGTVKLLAVAPVLLMVLSSIAVVPIAFTGAATAVGPAGMIDDWHDLDAVRNDPGGDYVLVADLDENAAGYDQVAGPNANGGAGFQPIGSYGDQFTGTFDGNGHTISGLMIDRGDEYYVGLFGVVGEGGTITSVGLEGVDVSGKARVGGLAGGNLGEVRESYATGSVSGTGHVGGLVGMNSGVVGGSYATGDVSGGSPVGGLAGWNWGGEVRESYATGSVSGDSRVGGLVGENEGAVERSYWDVDATGRSAGYGNGGETFDAVGLTTVEMKGSAVETTMDGFDFGKTWAVVSGSDVSYPFLRNNARGPAPGLEVVEGASVSFGNDEIEQGQETSFTVEVTLEETGTWDATSVAALSSDDEGVATVADDGTATGTGVGTVPISAAYEDETDSAVLTVTPGPADSVTIEAQPDGVQTAGETITDFPAVVVTDEFGNRVEGVAVSVVALDGAGSIVSSQTIVETNGSGIATFEALAIETADEYRLELSIDADDDGVSTSDTATTEPLTVEPAAADSLTIETAPDSVTAGDSFVLTIGATDRYGNPAAGQGLADITLTSEFDGTVFRDEALSLDGDGKAEVEVESAVVTTADGEHALAATAEGINGGSADLAVDAGDADSVMIETGPGPAQVAGETSSSVPRANVTDEFGNPVEGVAVSVETIDGTGTIASGETTVETNGSGIATFDDIAIEVADEYRLDFAIDADDDGVVASDTATTETFAVEPADADSVTVEIHPDGTQTAGEPITGSSKVTVADEFGNPVEGVAVSVETIDGTGTIAAGKTIVETNGSGIATFDDLVLEAADEYRLAFSIDAADGNVATTDEARTDAFAVEAADPDELNVVGTPGAITAGDSFVLTIGATDRYGNPNVGAQIDVSVWSEHAGIAFERSTVTLDAHGEARIEIAAQEVTTADDAYELLVRSFHPPGSAELLDDEIVAIVVEPADADSVTVETQPDGVQTAGEELTHSSKVTVTDEFGNPVEGVAVSVEAIDGKGAIVSGETTVETNGSGIATFDDLVLEAADEYRLAFSIDAADGNVATTDEARTNAFVVEPADADSVTVVIQPEKTTAGETIEGTPTARVADAFDNAIEGADVTVAANGSGVLVGTTTVKTDSDGLAAFGDLRIETAATYKLEFDAAGVPENATTETFAVEPGDVERVEIAADDATAIEAGETVAFDATAYDAYDNLIEDDDSAFDWQKTTADGTFERTTVGSYEVSATFDGVTADAGTVTVEPGEVDSVVIESPDQTITADDELELSVTAYDAYDNVVADDDSAFAWTNATADGTFTTTTVGSYEVTATFADAVTDAVIITVDPGAVALVTVESSDNLTIAVGETIVFDATAYDAHGNVVEDVDTEFEWVNATDGLFERTEVGAYEVKAELRGELSAPTTVTVRDVTSPTADAGGDRTVDETAQVSFDASNSTDNVGIASYEWDFGDGSANSTAETVSHTYDDPGTYTVALTVTDAAGNRGTETLTVTVRDVTSPTADAGGNRTVDEDTAVTFDASSSSDNVDVTSYTWDFGDGNISTGVNVTHSYPRPGTYTLNLTVSDEAGNTGTDSLVVTVNDTTSPTAVAGPDQTIDEDTAASFDGGNSADNVGITGYSWDFGDGNAATGATANHTFADPGTYTVELNVTDAAGNWNTDALVVTVNDTTPPTPTLGKDTTVRVGTEVGFNGSISTDNVGVVSYEWTFGDGTNATGATTNHTFGSTGTFAITLNATDAAGNVGSAVRNVTVRPLPQPPDISSPAESAGDDTSGTTVEMDTTDDDDGDVRSNVSVRNVDPDRPIVVSFDGAENASDGDVTGGNATDGGQTPVENISVSQLTLNVSNGEDFTLNVTTFERSEANDTDAEFQRDTGATSAGYVLVDHSVLDEDIEDVTFQFRVRKAYLETTDLDPDTVALYRDEGTNWRELDATLVGETDTHYVFEAISPGLSVFVIGSTVPVFDVRNATLDATTVRPDEAVDVTLSVANSGGADGAFDVAVLANGDRVATDSLLVEAFGVATATIPVAFDRPGTYELTVTGEPVGALNVESGQVTESTSSPTSMPTLTATPPSSPAPTLTVTPPSSPTPTSLEESNDRGSWWPIVIGLLALIAIASLVRFWRDDA